MDQEMVVDGTNSTAYATEQARWQALVQRDRRADGAFVYGVTTTGVYCRPGCASRRPKRSNVRFFETGQEAEQAGFRACKRCSPHLPGSHEPHRDAIVQACQLIERSEEPPALAELADAAGLSPSYFSRVFKRVVGVTPKQYAMEKRLDRVRANLQEGATVTDAVHNAGFASGSRFYTDATATLGMRPSEYREGGAGVRIRYAVAQCSLGWVLVAATEKGVCAIDFGDEPKLLEEQLHARFPTAELVGDDPGFSSWMAEVLAFLDSPHYSFDLPLDIRGTAFQRRVWMALQTIPAGSTVTYGEVAARIGSPKAARAVAGACASNKIAVAIPCHRVVRGDGGLGGYRWGVERKRKLLEQERTT